jgi:hypothetical protein
MARRPLAFARSRGPGIRRRSRVAEIGTPGAQVAKVVRWVLAPILGGPPDADRCTLV